MWILYSLHFTTKVPNHMATPHPPKWIQLLNSTRGQVEVGKIVSDAQSIPFPWTEAVPEQIRNCFAKSHNTAPDMCLLGHWWQLLWWWDPKVLWKWRRPTKNPQTSLLYVLGFRGLEKAKHTEWLYAGQSSHYPLHCLILVDNYTKKAYLGTYRITDFDLVQKRQLEGNAEHQLYCRLYDGGKWVTSWYE